MAMGTASGGARSAREAKRGGTAGDGPRLQAMKARGERITMLTAYDYRSARLFDLAGVDVLFVGDSLGMVVLGHEFTVPVTVEDILHHTRAVARAARRALVVADLPFMSYTISREQALANAARLIQQGGAQAVKLEGGRAVAPRGRRDGGERDPGDRPPGPHPAVDPPLRGLPRAGA